jgi:hypothetical protein
MAAALAGRILPEFNDFANRISLRSEVVRELLSRPLTQLGDATRNSRQSTAPKELAQN